MFVSPIRGICDLTNGSMKVSYNWLQEHIVEPLPKPDELKEKIIFHAFEVESMETIGSDTVYDVKVLPDRAGDCLSHVGIAREVAGLYGFTIRKKDITTLPPVPLTLSIEIKTDLCRRYIAICIDGVKVTQSPQWLKEKLEHIGQKSINTVVDIANYVMFDTGQPVHIFDTNNVDGGIIVRNAHKDEKVITLSNEEKMLNESDIVIADFLGSLAIAGVKGGKTAEVTEKTTSIIIEVANFDPITVRKTSRRIGLLTDASKRFENNFSPEFAMNVATQVVHYIREHAGGVIMGVKDWYKNPIQSQTVTFSTVQIQSILGETITTQKIEGVFNQYHYSFEQNDNLFTLAIPLWRNDIKGPHDIAEEIGRVVGYDTIESKVLPFLLPIEKNNTDIRIESARTWCIEHGYREVYTYTFGKKGEVNVAYGSKDKSALRTNLSDGLKQSYEMNRLNAPLLGETDIKLFEIGIVFFTDREEIHVALIDKGIVQELSLTDFLKQNVIEEESRLPKEIAKPLTQFRPWSSFPFITRDIAVWISSYEAKARLEEKVSTFAARYCVRPPFLFDEFSKDGRTSVAYRLVFQASDRTLTDEEVSRWFSTLEEDIAAEPAFEIR